MVFFSKILPVLFLVAPVICYAHEGSPVGHFVRDPSKSAEWNRGAQYVQSEFKCAQCHTPRENPHEYKIDGPLSGYHAPNITPDPKTGTGKWTEKDMTYFLQSGMTPDDNSAGGEMVRVIRETSKLSDVDRKSIAVYIKSLKPEASTMVHHMENMEGMGDMKKNVPAAPAQPASAK